VAGITPGIESRLSRKKKPSAHQISTLNEKSLHADLKAWYACPGDRLEVSVDGFLVDIVRPRRGKRDRDLLVEIQTRNFASIRRKLDTLSDRYPVRLVYPIPKEKWIVRLADDGEGRLGRRKSPKRWSVFDLFQELVFIPALLARRNFSLELLFIHEEEVRRYEEGRAWRRKGWVVHERRLIEVVENRLFKIPRNLGSLLPSELAEPFTTSDLAEAINEPRWLAQKVAYCLREMGTIQAVGKNGNAILYRRGRN
jgi:hypothetical protein